MAPAKLSKLEYIRSGQVLRTHPIDEYWGCAIVLSERARTSEFHPMCHIAITDLVLPHPPDFDQISFEGLNVVVSEQQNRVAPMEYVPLRRAPAIGIYTREKTPFVDVIGEIDPAPFKPEALSFTAGDGTDGGFPLCGPVSNNLGYEAVVAWRKKTEPEAWAEFVEERQAETEAVLTRDRRTKR